MNGEYERPKKRVTVQFTLTNGEVEEGVFLMPLDDNLIKLMNNDYSFFEFEDMEGRINLLSKAAVSRVVELGEIRIAQEKSAA